MTTHTATRADRIPPGLCLIYAHGECPGGLAWKGDAGWVAQVAIDADWYLRPRDTTDYYATPLTWLPTETALASPDPRVRAYAEHQQRHSTDHTLTKEN